MKPLRLTRPVSIEMPLLEVGEAGVSIEMPLLLPFSLTKYSAIFSEVKGSFGVNNNQLLGFEAAIDNVLGILSLDSISFARCIPLKSFRKMSLLLRCESNAFPNV